MPVSLCCALCVFQVAIQDDSIKLREASVEALGVVLRSLSDQETPKRRCENYSLVWNQIRKDFPSPLLKLNSHNGLFQRVQLQPSRAVGTLKQLGTLLALGELLDARNRAGIFMNSKFDIACGYALVFAQECYSMAHHEAVARLLPQLAKVRKRIIIIASRFIVCWDVMLCVV